MLLSQFVRSAVARAGARCTLSQTGFKGRPSTTSSAKSVEPPTDFWFHLLGKVRGRTTKNSQASERLNMAKPDDRRTTEQENDRNQLACPNCKATDLDFKGLRNNMRAVGEEAGAEPDVEVVSETFSWKCKKCKHEFEITIPN
jgi:rubredoxin